MSNDRSKFTLSLVEAQTVRIAELEQRNAELTAELVKAARLLLEATKGMGTSGPVVSVDACGHSPEQDEWATRMEAELVDGPIGIETGDHVHHAPSGETWVVAYVRGGHLMACGWPESMARLSDCTLIKKATPAERRDLLARMAEGTGNDSRTRYAKAILDEAGSGQQGRVQAAEAEGSDEKTQGGTQGRQG